MTIHILPAAYLSSRFLDCLHVRYTVFVSEQLVPASIELDEDEPRCLHWVAYTDDQEAEKPSMCGHELPAEMGEIGESEEVKGGWTPVGNLRLVPAEEGSGKRYIKLSRVAVTIGCRKSGVGRKLVQTALDYAANHPEEMVPASNGTFDGRVLVHAQVPAISAWRKYGFEVDPKMGEWDEGGIAHVGMWKTVDVKRVGEDIKTSE